MNILINPLPANPSRRLKALPLTPEALEDILNARAGCHFHDDRLPTDVRPVGLWFDPYGQLFLIILESASFDEVPEGECLWRIDALQFRQTDPPGPACSFLSALKAFLEEAKASVRVGDLKNAVIWPASYRPEIKPL